MEGGAARSMPGTCDAAPRSGRRVAPRTAFAAPPVLILDARASGSLEALRQLADHGVAGMVLERSTIAKAKASRFAGRRLRLSSTVSSDPEILAAALAASGGGVLLPTSDRIAWLCARHAERLGRHAMVYQPGLAAIETLLDKRSLDEAARAVGIATLPSWFPTLGDVSIALPADAFPVIAKPRSHVGRRRTDKGFVAADAGALERGLATMATRESDVQLLVQSLADGHGDGVVSLSGFIDSGGEHLVVRASRKLMQRTRPAGIGLCFEAIEPDPLLTAQIEALCRRVGFFGIFEAEFVAHRGRLRLIDFNPRLFHQLALDRANGASLAWFAWLDACGDRVALARAVSEAQVPNDRRPILIDSFTFGTTVLAGVLFGRMSARDAGQWLGWLWRRRDDIVDIAFRRDDPLPWLAHAAVETGRGLRAIPRFLRGHRIAAPGSRP